MSEDPARIPAAELDAFARRIQEARARIAPALPEVDPGDLLCILQCLLRPPGWGRRIFLRREREGVYVS